MDYPHKFLSAPESTNQQYVVVVFCQKCGLVAFNSNSGELTNHNMQRKIMDIPCKYPDGENKPEPEAGK